MNIIESTKLHYPICYMLIGCPGAGKTTWVLKNHPELGHASTDKYIDQFAAEQGISYNDAFMPNIKEATSRMIDDVQNFQFMEQDFVWDQTNMSKKSRANKIKNLVGYRVIAVLFETPEVEELQKRLASRPGKTIPKYVLESMIASYEVPTLDEGFYKIMIAEK